MNSEWRSGVNALIAAVNLSECASVVRQVQPALERHVFDACMRLDAGPPGFLERVLKGEPILQHLPRMDLLQLLAINLSNTEVGRRGSSVESLLSGHVAYRWSESLGQFVARFIYAYDKVPSAHLHRIPHIDAKAVAALMACEQAFDRFVHEPHELKICCAKHPFTLPHYLFQRLDCNGVPTGLQLNSDLVGLALVLAMGADGHENICGKSRRSGVATDDTLRSVVARGPVGAEVIQLESHLKAGWRGKSDTNQGPLYAYSREVGVSAIMLTRDFSEQTHADREARRAIVAELAETLVERVSDFDAASAVRGHAALLAFLTKRYPSGGMSWRGLLSDADGAVPPLVVSGAMSVEVLRLQLRLRHLLSDNRLKQPGSARFESALRELAAVKPAAALEVTRLLAEVEVALEAALGVAVASASQPRVAIRSLPRRHLNLDALAENPRYRYTLEQLATLSEAEMAVLLADPAVSYECKLARV